MSLYRTPPAVPAHGVFLAMVALAVAVFAERVSGKAMAGVTPVEEVTTA